jgi:protein-disulfide isomerase
MRARTSGRRAPTAVIVTVGVALAAAVVAAGVHWVTSSPPPAAAPPAPVLEPGGKTRGRADAPVVIAVYSDFLCSHCADFALGTEPAIVREFVEPGVARLVYRHFPVVAGESEFLAELSECAADQQRFWAFHNALLARTARRTLRAMADVDAAARDAGLDVDRLKACQSGSEVRARVDDDRRAGERRGVTGTPTIFVGDRRIVGNVGIEVIREAVRAATPR